MNESMEAESKFKEAMFNKAHKLKGATPDLDVHFPDTQNQLEDMVRAGAEMVKNTPVAPQVKDLPPKPMDVLSESQFVVWTELEKNGFVWNLTLRKGITSLEIDSVLSLIDTAQLKAISKGFKYHEKKSNFPAKKVAEFIEGKACPKCGEKLVKGVGKVAEKCSTNKYDFTTKTSSGCDYVLWN